MMGSQAQLEFLPERSTDFIFAVIGEEFGLLGQLFILTLYGVVIGRALYLSMQAQGTFARLTGGAIALSFFVYVFVNSGMVQRHLARGRRAAASDQLRRHLDGHAARRLRHPHVAAFASQADWILNPKRHLVGSKVLAPATLLVLCAALLAIGTEPAAAIDLKRPEVKDFINQMAGGYGFKKRALRKLLKSAQSQRPFSMP